MHTRTRHTTAFAGHHFDELPRSLARFGICTQQSNVLLRKVSDLNRVEVSDLVFFQIHLHSIDHASGLGKSMRLTYSIEQDGERLCLFHLYIHSGQHRAYFFERKREIHTRIHLHLFPLRHARADEHDLSIRIFLLHDPGGVVHR